MLEEFLVLLLLGCLALVTAWIRNLSALPDTTGLSIGTLGNVQSYQARKRAAEQRVANVVKNTLLDEDEDAMVTNVSVSAVPATALSYPRQFVVPVSSPLKPYLVPRSPMILTRSESFVRLQRRRKLEKRKEGDLEEEEEAARKRREQDRRERREKMRRKRERERQFARREEQREESEEAKGEEEELFRELCGAVRENNAERVGELLQAAESSFNITAEKKNDNESSRRKQKERRKKRQKETSRDEKESGEGEAEEEEAEPTETAEDGAVMFRAKIVAPTSDSDDEEAETEEEERQLVEDLDDAEAKEEEEENEGVEDDDDENGGAQLLSQLLSRKEETFGETLVHIAAANGSEEVLRLLLSKGASPNATDENGNTPLHSASGEGHSGCCQLLVDAGAEVNAVDHSRGNTPLHRCVEPDDFPECCAILLDQHAQVDLPNHQGMTALHKAAAAGSLECMDLLLKAGASTAVEDAEGNTPLHAAASSLSGNAMEACMMVVGGPQGARADLKARNRAGQAPKGVARTRGNEELVVLLLEMEWRQPVKQGEKQQRTEDGGEE